jgi:hypothetical protein
MIDLDTPLPRSVRPLGKVPAGAHVLSHSDLRAIAKHFAGREDARLGEELIPHILHHSMFGADTGRIIPRGVLAELGNGDHHAGRKVLRKFLDNIRQGGRPAYARGGAVRLSKTDAGYEPCGDENRICVLCSMWRDKYRCSLVQGHIDRTGTCNHFERR